MYLYHYYFKQVHGQSQSWTLDFFKMVIEIFEGSSQWGLCFNSCNGIVLKGFVDTDIVGDSDNKKSIHICLFWVELMFVRNPNCNLM